MKRCHEGEHKEEETRTSKPRTEETESKGENTILNDLKTNLLKGDLNSQIEKRLFETQKEYFTVYMEKLMHKIPMGEELVKIIQSRGSPHEFEYMFTAAKSVIQSQMQVKQIKAFHAVFDMVYSIMSRYVHEKVVSPTLEKVLSSKQLNLAYEKYQQCSNIEEDGSVIEMQCLLYCIQDMLESQEPVKITNPLYSRLTQQVKAMSEYVIALLVALAKPTTLSDDYKGETEENIKRETGQLKGNVTGESGQLKVNLKRELGQTNQTDCISKDNIDLDLIKKGSPNIKSDDIEIPITESSPIVHTDRGETNQTMKTSETFEKANKTESETDSQESYTSESE